MVMQTSSSKSAKGDNMMDQTFKDMNAQFNVEITPRIHQDEVPDVSTDQYIDQLRARVVRKDKNTISI